MKTDIRSLQDSRPRGQSLVEVALIMPVLILLVAGLVEISHMALTANRVTTAARNAARFGANGGEDVGMRNIILNTVTQTLDLSSGYWDIYSIRGLFDQNGNLPAANLQYSHIYGDGLTGEFAQTTTSEFWEDIRLQIQGDMQLNAQGQPDADAAAGLRVAGVLIFHDVESILGLDVIPTLTGMKTVRGFSYMRQVSLADAVKQSQACTGVFPLILDVQTRSITQAEFNALTFPRQPRRNWNQYPGHVPDVELEQGAEGYLYRFHVGSNMNNPYPVQSAGIVQWDRNMGGTQVANYTAAMTWPGTSHRFKDPTDTADTELQIGDYLAHSSAGLTAASSALGNHITSERALRFPLWDSSDPNGYRFNWDGSGAGNNIFRVVGFAVFRVREYSNAGDWILLELYNIDRSCGQAS